MMMFRVQGLGCAHVFFLQQKLHLYVVELLMRLCDWGWCLRACFASCENCM